MKKVRDYAAGIDIGARKLFVGIENQEVKIYDTFTQDMEQLALYLLSHKITSVAPLLARASRSCICELINFHSHELEARASGEISFWLTFNYALFKNCKS